MASPSLEPLPLPPKIHKRYGAAAVDACRQLNARLAPFRAAQPGAGLRQLAAAAYLERVDLCAHGFHATPDITGYGGQTPFNYMTYGERARLAAWCEPAFRSRQLVHPHRAHAAPPLKCRLQPPARPQTPARRRPPAHLPPTRRPPATHPPPTCPPTRLLAHPPTHPPAYPPQAPPWPRWNWTR